MSCFTDWLAGSLVALATFGGFAFAIVRWSFPARSGRLWGSRRFSYTSFAFATSFSGRAAPYEAACHWFRATRPVGVGPGQLALAHGLRRSDRRQNPPVESIELGLRHAGALHRSEAATDSLASGLGFGRLQPAQSHKLRERDGPPTRWPLREHR